MHLVVFEFACILGAVFVRQLAIAVAHVALELALVNLAERGERALAFPLVVHPQACVRAPIGRGECAKAIDLVVRKHALKDVVVPVRDLSHTRLLALAPLAFVDVAIHQRELSFSVCDSFCERNQKRTIVYEEGCSATRPQRLLPCGSTSCRGLAARRSQTGLRNRSCLTARAVTEGKKTIFNSARQSEPKKKNTLPVPWRIASNQSPI